MDGNTIAITNTRRGGKGKEDKARSRQTSHAAAEQCGGLCTVEGGPYFGLCRLVVKSRRCGRRAVCSIHTRDIITGSHLLFAPSRGGFGLGSIQTFL